MADQTTSQIETLQQIWQRIFQRSTIGPDDDFFDLGGNAWLAAELFTEIDNDFGINLPAATICTAPAITTLSAALGNRQFLGPAILLRKGTTQAVPIFMFHGIGSSIVDLVTLARRVHLDHAIYGLESRGNDGREEPQERIEEIAESFLAAIREIQPHGPYFLIGYSFGGLVAFELAQQLKAKSEEIGLLVMLDSYPDRRYLSLPQYWRLVLQLARKRVRGRTDPAAAPLTRLRRAAGQPNSLVHALQKVKYAHYRALRNYRPRFYDGEVKFIRAAVPSDFPADPVPVWSHLVRHLEVETIEGKHVTMLTGSGAQLAALLERHLRRARDRGVS